MKNKFCPHCHPQPPNHLPDKVVSYFETLLIDPLAAKLAKILPVSFLRAIDYGFVSFLLKFLIFIKLVEEVKEIDRSQFYNRTLVIWDEAKKRNLDIRAYRFRTKSKRYLSLFSWHNEKQKKYFQELPLFDFFSSNYNFDNKDYFRQLLLKNNWPVATGGSFFSIEKAYELGRKIGFPLVVKPNDSSLSRHAFFNLNDWETFKTALKSAKEISAKVIVERYVPGNVYRATVVDGQLIACAKRMPATIIGNGEATIEKLISDYNNHPWRLPMDRRDATLHQIALSDDLKKYLASINCSLETILPRGEKLILAQKITLGAGSEIINVTEQLHPQTKQLCESIAKELSFAVAGLDFICEDEGLSFKNQPFVFLENNTLPYIDMHHFPSQGGSINVAEKIWEQALKK